MDQWVITAEQQTDDIRSRDFLRTDADAIESVGDKIDSRLQSVPSFEE